MTLAPVGRFQGGFTLIEVLVALMVAGLLTAMVASILGRGVVASSALEETARGQQARVVLRRMLSMDLRNILQDSGFVISEDGFAVKTSHNYLVQGPLPVTATWNFSGNGITRKEEQPELSYAWTLTVAQGLDRWEMAFFDLTENRWMDQQPWLRSPERPAPAGLRLRLLLKGIGLVEIIERLPLQPDALS